MMGNGGVSWVARCRMIAVALSTSDNRQAPMPPWTLERDDGCDVMDGCESNVSIGACQILEEGGNGSR